MRNWFFLILFIVTLLFISPTHALFGKQLCKTTGYFCVKVKHGQTWERLFPNEHERSIAMRVNRMNTQIYPGIIIAIPDNIVTADIMDFSPFPRTIEAPQEKLVIIDPLLLAWGAFDVDGTLIRWGPVSAGADYCRDIDRRCHTKPGSYRIYSLGSSGCISHKFPLPNGGAPMPYCMYFNSGQALHGEPNGVPGYNASHGCVRLYVNDAEWLRYDFIESPNASNQYRGTRIVIKPYNLDGLPEEDDDSSQDLDTSQDLGDNQDATDI